MIILLAAPRLDFKMTYWGAVVACLTSVWFQGIGVWFYLGL